MAASKESERIIVDLGMHTGEDTDFYLRKGFKVLGVEAAPHLVQLARERFRDAIESGRLTILPVAVTDFEGEIDLYLSDEDLWTSTRPDMADRGHGRVRKKVTVPCTTLDAILEACPTPYFVKIDVEGQDVNCVKALGRLSEMPRFVSFEADLPEPGQTEAMLAMLEGYGYRKFKLVNQAVHSTLRLPNPPLEGLYAEPRFSKHSSGPFGEEAPGDWLTGQEVRQRFHATIKQQALRIEYSAKGTAFGIPVAKFHRVLLWLYNARTTTWFRALYAERRGIEMGGWFDIHASL